ncbi:Bifunctional uridylyltransferase/uridylyl-removing enzyme [Frankliniella fusca]|uniref:Bifunctional uridylyltransferase/uridylyl-removing enzyme n=1 Tax=Frankliniella fusca TaxID=407009 RepID=A0AAE1LB65_9NEOP|nr:Bifunctional uridylyltransferase/uridylyl-removing enzyme [Frankliniella fusca]
MSAAVMDTMCHNENISNCYRSFLASAAKRQQRRSALDRKIHKLKKMLKPVLSLVRGRNDKSYYYKGEAEPCCWPQDADVESDNAANEALESRLLDELAHPKGASIQVWVGGQVVEIPIVPGQPQVIPVHFVIDQDAVNGFCWTPMSADSDLCCSDAAPYITENQVAEVQAPFQPCDTYAPYAACGDCTPCAC